MRATLNNQNLKIHIYIIKLVLIACVCSEMICSVLLIVHVHEILVVPRIASGDHVEVSNLSKGYKHTSFLSF